MAATDDQLQAMYLDIGVRLDKVTKGLANLSSTVTNRLKEMEGRASTFEQRMQKAFEGAGGKAPMLEELLRSSANAAEALAGRLGLLGSVLSAAGGGFLIAGAGAGGFATVLAQGTEKLAEHERLLSTISAELRASGAASGQTAASIEEMAEQIAGSTLQTRDSVLEAAKVLLTFRNVGPDAFERTLQSAADLAEVTSGSLTDATEKLGRALEQPAEGMNALRRAGIEFSPAQKELIENFEKTGETAKAQGVILDALRERIGGAGAGASSGLTGAVHNLGTAWSEMEETFAKSAGSTHFAEGLIDGIAAAISVVTSKAKEGSASLTDFLAKSAIVLASPGNVATSMRLVHALPSPQLPAPSASGASAAEAEAAKQGPARARAEAEKELADAVGDAAKALREKVSELRKSPLAQAIDKSISDAAGKVGLSSSGLIAKAQNDPALAAQLAQIRDAATAEYNLVQARKSSSDAARLAIEAERKLAEQRVETDKLIDRLKAEAAGAGQQPGAARAAFVQEQVDKIATPMNAGAAYQSDRAQVYTAAGEEFDAQTLNEVLAKGKALAQSYRDQAEAMGDDKAAAEADKFQHDALATVLQKLGNVSDDARAKIQAQADAIKASGEAAQKAAEAMKSAEAVTQSARDGLEHIADAALDGTKKLKDVIREALLNMANTALNKNVMDPLLSGLFGAQAQGTPSAGGLAGNSGGLLGKGVSWLAGTLGFGSSSGAAANAGADIGKSAADAGASGWLSSLLSFFAEGGIMTNRGPVALRSYAGGGVADSPQLAMFGEGDGPEAFVPLSGGHIPVRLSVPRVGNVAAKPNQIGVTNTFHVDARGAQEGVADQIDSRLRAYAPAIIGESVRQAMGAFPEKLRATLRDKG